MRGRLGSLQQLAVVVGIFTALLSNFLISRAAGSAEAAFWFGAPAWRWMFWTGAIPSVLYGVGAFFIPESPRYLVAEGRLAAANTVLSKIETGDATVKIEEIRRTVQREHKPRLSDLLSARGGLFPIVWVGIGLSLLQQLVGINVIFYYSTVLWRSVGFTEENSLLISMITGLTNIATTFLAIALIEKFGRRLLLMVGSVGMALALGTMAFLFGNAPVDAAGNPSLSGGSGIAALVAANAFVFFFGFSWGPVVWVLLGEMFSNRIRGMALAVSAAVQWIANFGVSLTFPIFADRFGLGFTYGIYAVSAAASLFFVALLVRETKGKELEEMQD
jgi:sugar porter (SP) family MFS transporter